MGHLAIQNRRPGLAAIAALSQHDGLVHVLRQHKRGPLLAEPAQDAAGLPLDGAFVGNQGGAEGGCHMWMLLARVGCF